METKCCIKGCKRTTTIGVVINGHVFMLCEKHAERVMDNYVNKKIYSYTGGFSVVEKIDKEFKMVTEAVPIRKYENGLILDDETNQVMDPPAEVLDSKD